MFERLKSHVSIQQLVQQTTTLARKTRNLFPIKNTIKAVPGTSIFVQSANHIVDIDAPIRYQTQQDRRGLHVKDDPSGHSVVQIGLENDNLHQSSEQMAFCATQHNIIQPELRLRHLEFQTSQDDNLTDHLKIGEQLKQQNVGCGPSSDSSSFVSERNPTYLQNHVQMMYYMGLSPISGYGEYGSAFHTICCALIYAAAMIDSLGDVKDYMIQNTGNKNLFVYISAWYLSSSFILELYTYTLFVWNYNSTAAILKATNKSIPGIVHPPMNVHKRIKKAHWVYTSILVLIAIAEALRIDWYMLGYSTEEILLHRSKLVATHMFRWKKNDNGQNLTDEIKTQYGSELSVTTIGMGSIGYFIVFAGSLLKHFIRDILLMAALNVYKLSELFKHDVIRILHGANSNNSTLLKLDEIHASIVKMSDLVDFGMGNFFKFLHVDNLLFCSYFLLDMLHAETGNIYFAEAFLIIPKILLAYYISARTIKVKEEVEVRIVETFKSSDFTANEKLNAGFYLNKLNMQVIGIGRGEFVIDEAFGLKFIGVVISCFLLIADSAKETS